MLDFPEFKMLTIDGLKESKCVILPNSIAILPTVAELRRFSLTVFRLHRSTTYIDAAYCYWSNSVVCQSVCRSDCHTSEPCKNGCTDRDAVWVEDSGEAKEPCIRWGSRSLRGKGQFWGVRGGYCKVQEHSAVICAKTAERIEMPIGFLAWMGLRNHVLDRGPAPPIGRGNFKGERGLHTTEKLDFLETKMAGGWYLDMSAVNILKVTQQHTEPVQCKCWWECILALPGKYGWTVHVRRLRLLSSYFDHLLLLLLGRIAILRT